MDSLEQDKARAERFERFYNQDGLKDAIKDIREAYIQGMVTSNYKDTDAREKCYMALNVIDKIEGHILNVIGGGKVAAKTLRAIEKENKVFKLF